MASLDRAGLIVLLDRLGSDSDAEALEAARALHREVIQSGVTWNDLIRQDLADRSQDEAPSGKPADASDTARLIDKLLHKELSDSLREDLIEMKRNIALGNLDGMDGSYVRALARRLGVPGS